MTEARALRVVNRDGLHARPAALLAGAIAALEAEVTLENPRTGTPPVAVTGPTSILMLAARRGDTLLATSTGADATAALDALDALLRAGFGEPLDDDAPAPRAPTGPIGMSPGRAVAPALRMPQPITEPPARPPAADDRERIERAMAAVAAQLRERAETADGEAREILAATAAFAADAALLEDAVARLEHGAERAIWLAATALAERLRSQGGRIAERSADVLDLRGRLVAKLLGLPTPGVPEHPGPCVLIAHDLAPVDTAALDPTRCVAIATEQGGPTSHTAIIARSLGIPAVVAPGALGIAEGTVLLVDGTTGRLQQNPSPSEIAAVESAAPAVFGGAGATRDGHAIQLLANVGSPASVAAAVEAGAQGVGLFRTEFCFLDRDTAPTVDEQVAAYRPVFAAFAGRRVVVRTLDAGADKPLAFVNERPAEALGLRGLRAAWQRPELLDDQLRAIALAAAAEKAVVWVMAPMVSTVDEAADFASACARHGIASSGVVIETPAAALSAREIAAAVAFVSIGTNDLTQYTMAADRQLGELAHLNDPWQPAVLRLVELAAASTTKPVGVCGEAAADPMLAAVLVGLGVDSLSMSPRAIAAVAAALGSVTLDRCRQAAAAATAAPTAAHAREAAVSILTDGGIG